MTQTKVEQVRCDFQSRLAKLNKTELLTFTDKLDAHEPLSCADYAATVYENMRATECLIDQHYLEKVQLPTEVKETSRAFLIEWIIDVHRKFRLASETLNLTVHLIDRFLSLQQIKKSQLHILGVTSLLIATKYEEIYPPELKDLLQVSENKFTKEQVLEMELQMLQVLEFSITTPTSYRFLERFKKLAQVDDQTFFFAQYLQEVAMLDASLLKYKPSELAAACLVLSA